MREPCHEFASLRPAVRWIEKWVDTPTEFLPSDVKVLTRMLHNFGDSVTIVKSYQIANYAEYFSSHWLAARGVYFKNAFDFSDEMKPRSRPQMPSNRWHEEILTPTSDTRSIVFIRKLFAALIRDLFCRIELHYLPFHERRVLLEELSEASNRFLTNLHAVLVNSQEVGDSCPEPPHIKQLRLTVKLCWNEVSKSAQAIEDAICKSFFALQSHFETRIHELRVAGPYGHPNATGRRARENLINGNNTKIGRANDKKAAAIAELLRRHEDNKKTTKTSILQAMAKICLPDGKAKFGCLRTLTKYCRDVPFYPAE